MFCEWCAKDVETKVVHKDSPEAESDHLPARRTAILLEKFLPDDDHILLCKDCGSPSIFLSENIFISEVEGNNEVWLFKLEEKLKKERESLKDSFIFVPIGVLLVWFFTQSWIAGTIVGIVGTPRLIFNAIKIHRLKKEIAWTKSIDIRAELEEFRLKKRNAK